MSFRGAPTARSVLGGSRTAIPGPAPAIVRRTRSLRSRGLARGDVSRNSRRASRRETASGSCTPLWVGGRPGGAPRGVWRSNCSISCTFACCGPPTLRRACKTPGNQTQLDVATGCDTSYLSAVLFLAPYALQPPTAALQAPGRPAGGLSARLCAQFCSKSCIVRGGAKADRRPERVRR